MKKNKSYNLQENQPMAVEEPIALYLNDYSMKNNILDNLNRNSRILFNEVINKTGLSIQKLSENFFEITPKTFIKYKNTDTKIPTRITELALELNLLYDFGNELFGSNNSFNAWLEKINPFFNNQKPASFLNTSAGIHLIYEELKRIEFGATA